MPFFYLFSTRLAVTIPFLHLLLVVFIKRLVSVPILGSVNP